MSLSIAETFRMKFPITGSRKKDKIAFISLKGGFEGLPTAGREETQRGRRELLEKGAAKKSIAGEGFLQKSGPTERTLRHVKGAVLGRCIAGGTSAPE